MSGIGPGDLCVVVKSYHPENLGIICQVDSVLFRGQEAYVDGRRLRVATWSKSRMAFLVYTKGSLFTVSTGHPDGTRTNPTKCRASLFARSKLRKLDFNDGVDEMLALVGKPLDLTSRIEEAKETL